jgi:hypothetical protein
VGSDIRLGALLPQILPGHRLWCYATNHGERFLTAQKIDILHSPVTREVWLDLYVDRNELERLGVSDAQALSQLGLARDFEVVVGAGPGEIGIFQQQL